MYAGLPHRHASESRAAKCVTAVSSGFSSFDASPSSSSPTVAGGPVSHARPRTCPSPRGLTPTCMRADVAGARRGHHGHEHVLHLLLHGLVVIWRRGAGALEIEHALKLTQPPPACRAPRARPRDARPTQRQARRLLLLRVTLFGRAIVRTLPPPPFHASGLWSVGHVARSVCEHPTAPIGSRRLAAHWLAHCRRRARAALHGRTTRLGW